MIDPEHLQSKIILQASACLDILIVVSRELNKGQPATPENNEKVFAAINSLKALAEKEYPKNIASIKSHLLIIENYYLHNQTGIQVEQAIFNSISQLDHDLGTWAI